MSKAKGWIFILSVAALFVVCFSSTTTGQELATLRVDVLDPSGALIPGARVVLRNKNTGFSRHAIASDLGSTVLASLTPGMYQLRVSADSFELHREEIQLTVGQVATRAVRLSIVLSDEIGVVAGAVALDPERAEMSQVVDESLIDNLPIQGRQFIDFALLTPSVTVGRSTSSPSQSPFGETVLKLSFAGLRETHTSFIALDGMDYSTSISGVQRVSPSQDWIQEFQVVLSPLNVDTGRHLGGIVNSVTKSGTNEFHGTVYEFFRNDALNAANLLSKPGFETLRLNNFGFALGGPVAADRTFFFTGYEGQRRAESPIYSDFILQNIGSINFVKQSLGLSAEDLGSILQIDDFDQFIIKVDHQITPDTFLNARYLFNDQRNEDAQGAPPGLGLPSSFRHHPVRDQTAAANLVKVSARSTSETSFQYGNRSFLLEPRGAGLEPALQIPNLMTSGGIIGGFMQYDEERLQINQSFSWSSGNHLLKFGGEFHRIWNHVLAPVGIPAFAAFSPEGFFSPQPTPLLFLVGEPREFFGVQIPARDPNFEAGLFAGPAGEAFRQANTAEFSHEIYAAFIQDQWRVRPNLTVTLGLRYEVETMPSNLAQGRFHETDFNNVQPRIGFALSFHDNRAVLRAGAGIYTGPVGFSDLLGSAVNGGPIGFYLDNPLIPQFQNPEQSLIGFSSAGPVGTIPIPQITGPAFRNFLQFGAYPPPEVLLQFPLGFAQKDNPSPYSTQASLQLEHQLGSDFFVAAGYQYVHGLKLTGSANVNAVPVGQLPAGTNQLAPADFRFGFTLLGTPTGYSIYHAATASLRKRYSRGYSLLANYTYSKSVDYGTTIQLQTLPQDFSRIDLEHAPSDNHIAHRLTLAFNAEAPREGPLRDFRASVLVAAQSARLSTIFAGFDVNGDFFPFPDRVGAIGRNTYRGDPFFNLDLRIQRIFRFDRFQFEVSAEFFNLLNVSNVLDLNNVYGAPDFVGPVPQEFGDGIRGPVPSFGTPRNAASARQIQFGLRLRF